MPQVLSKPADVTPRNSRDGELDLVYSDSAPADTGAFQRFRQWFYNYVAPVLAILFLPLLIVPLAATFIMACARMHHDEPDSEIYGSEPINGPVKLEDPLENEQDALPATGAAKSAPAPASSYHWN